MVAAEDESARIRIVLHCSPKRALGVPGHVVGLIQDQNLERNSKERGHPGEFLHSGPDHVYSTFITRVQFLECVLESLPEKIMGQTQPGCGLTGPWRACEQAVGHCASLDEIFQSRDYLFLVHYGVETLWPVLLSPESCFQSDPTRHLDVLSHIELFHPPL